MLGEVATLTQALLWNPPGQIGVPLRFSVIILKAMQRPESMAKIWLDANKAGDCVR
jgi:hypothetical protein